MGKKTDDQKLEAFRKERIALRSWLLGRGWHSTVEAMTLVEKHSRGNTRKDGVTPEFAHQVQTTLYVTTLAPHLRHPEATATTMVLHDLGEDYDYPFELLRSQFGDQVADSTWRMTKVYQGVKRGEDDVFARLAEDPISSVNKGADRIHNMSTMVGVFSEEKILSYIEETERLILPMLKKARRNFPDQDGTYQNMRTVLISQVETLAALLGK